MARKTTRKILPRSDKISYAELAKYASEVQEENTKLKRLVADLTLDKTMLQDVLRKKW